MKSVTGIELKTIEEFGQWFSETVNLEGVEQYAVAVVDRSHRLLGHEVVATGDNSSVKVDPKKVFRFALKFDDCAAILTAHNHPGGKKKASTHDMNLAQELSSIGRKLRLPVACHVISTTEGHFEYAQRFNR